MDGLGPSYCVLRTARKAVLLCTEDGLGRPSYGTLYAALFQAHVQGKAADFVGEHVKAGWRAGFESVLAFDHRFVNLRTAFDVIALDRQQLLQDVSGTVSFQRPYFHLTEALATEASLATERLLVISE